MAIIHLIYRAQTAQAIAATRQLARETRIASDRMTLDMARVGRGVQTMGRGMMTMTAPLIGIGYYSGKAAMDFNTAMTRIQTQAGVGKAKVDLLSRSVLSLSGSGQVQYGPTELANALYHIESVAAGTYPELTKSGTAMKALKIAAQGAAVGGSDLEQTTSALMGVMIATRSKAGDLNNIMGLINATVGAGNMRMQDLVLAMGRGVVPAFRQVGLTATDAFGGIALLADSGVKASSGAAQLATSLHFLQQPSAKADKYLKLIGMTQFDMARDFHKPHGLITALSDLHDHLAQRLPGGVYGVDAGQVTAALLPGARGRVLLTLLQNLDKYKGKIDEIYRTEGHFQELAAAQAATPAGKFHTAMAQIKTDAVNFGNAILPLAVKILPQITKAVKGATDWFTHLSKGTQETIVKATIFTFIGGAILNMLGRMIWGLSQLWRAFAVLRGLGIISWFVKLGRAMAVTAAVEVGLAGGGAAGAIGAMGIAAKGALGRLAPLIPILSKLAKFAGIIGALYTLATQAPKLGKSLAKHKTGSSALHGALAMGGAGAAIGMIAGGPPGAAIGAIAGGIAGGASGALTSFLPFARGGVVPHYAKGGPTARDSVLGYLTPGEGVLTTTAMSSIGAGGLAALNNGAGFGGMGGITIQPSPAYFYLDGRLFARAMVNYTIQRAARGPSSLVGGSMATGTPSFGRPA